MSTLKEVINSFIVTNLNKLEGVDVIHCSVNDTYNYDYERAMPAMSFRIAVKGGDKKEIANTIWMNKPLGILSVGNTKVKVKDSEGFKHKIYFERVD